MKFIEKVNSKKCQFLLTMKKGDFETSFPNSDDDDGKSNNDCSFYSTVNYCRKQKKVNFALEVEYKRSVLNPISGRMYAKGASLQNLRSEVRKFLTQDIYKDYDMSNAHPSFLLEKCKLAGEGGIGKSKIRKVVRAVKKQGPKAIRASLALLDEFGSPETQEKVAKARLAGAIVKGAGVKPPGHKLRKLCNYSGQKLSYTKRAKIGLKVRVLREKVRVFRICGRGDSVLHRVHELLHLL